MVHAGLPSQSWEAGKRGLRRLIFLMSVLSLKVNQKSMHTVNGFLQRIHQEPLVQSTLVDMLVLDIGVRASLVSMSRTTHQLVHILGRRHGLDERSTQS